MRQKLPSSRNENLVTQEIGQEILIYDLTTHKVYGLNETAAIVYRACDGKTTFDELKQKHKWTDEIIFLALERFKEIGLFPENQFPDSPFTGMKRRDLIRKVGLASMVMLPVISSIVAPSAAMAASGGAALFGACPTAGGGGGCAPGLQCNRCFGTSCPSTNHCCATGGLTGKGPIIGNSCQANLTLCNATASQACCSGNATFTPDHCGNLPTSGTCSCI
jgi:hypothetical protein